MDNFSFGRDKMAASERRIRAALAAETPSDRLTKLRQAYDRTVENERYAFALVLIAHIAMFPQENEA